MTRSRLTVEDSSSAAIPPARRRAGTAFALAAALLGIGALGVVAPGRADESGTQGDAVPVPAGFPRGQFPLTDLSRVSVPLAEIRSGGPPRDGIPAIDAPRFVTAGEAAAWLDPREPVIAFAHGSDARAYPLQILIYHEIVNDTVDGLPVTVTFCPLCNASIVFAREVEGRTLDFGTTGRLRRSDLVMYDRQTESWWQQFTGRGIIGTYADVVLRRLPSTIVAAADFADAYPDGRVLSRETGHARPYGNNPYRGYDAIDSNPFLYDGEIDPRLPPMARVLALGGGAGGSSHLVPLGVLEKTPVLNLEIDGEPLLVSGLGRAASALDTARIAEGREVPAAAAWRASIDDGERRALSFVERDGALVDEQTGSRWDVFGRAVAGELEGAALEQVDRGVHFAFAWLAFEPGATVHGDGEDGGGVPGDGESDARGERETGRKPRRAR